MVGSDHSDMGEKNKSYFDEFKDNEWAYFLFPRINLAKDRDENIAVILNSNIRKNPLQDIVTFLKRKFNEKYPKAVEKLVIKPNVTKTDLAGLLVSFVQYSKPLLCLLCTSDYLPFSQDDSTDGDGAGSDERVQCFVCKTPAHQNCVDITTISEKQGIVFLCCQCVDRKKKEDAQQEAFKSATPPHQPSDEEITSAQPRKNDTPPTQKPKDNPQSPQETRNWGSASSSSTSSDESSRESSTPPIQRKKRLTKKSKSKEDTRKKEKTKDDADKPKKDAICTLLMEGKCPHGISGKTCEFKHIRYCRRFCSFGDSRYHKFGCRFGKDCRYLHPKLCKNSITMKACYNQECRMTHLKFTKRKKENDSYENHRHRYPRSSNATRNYRRPNQENKNENSKPNHASKSEKRNEENKDGSNDGKENSASKQSDLNETTSNFLGSALESMKKELSSLIPTLIQQQMQLQLLQLQKPQVTPNWQQLLNPPLQMQLTPSQKVPSPTSSQVIQPMSQTQW